MTDAPYLIKKYANRRLYDSKRGKFLNLEDIRNLIRDGHRVQVEDSEGRDVTRQILLQVIAECEDDGPSLLSAETLHILTRFYGDAMQGVFGHYLEHSVQTFLRQQKSWRQTLEAALEHGPLAAFEKMVKDQVNIWTGIGRDERNPSATPPASNAKKSKRS